jgi:hypothetical protein
MESDFRMPRRCFTGKMEEKITVDLGERVEHRNISNSSG